MKITPTTLTISQLFGQSNEQYIVPAYQRRYSWHEKQVSELIDDILSVEEGETHLLGSIVCLTGPHVAGLNTLELVDGQQRLTTISILMYSIRNRFRATGASEDADDVDRLLKAKALGKDGVPKVLLDSLDAPQFKFLYDGTPPEGGTNKQLDEAFKIFENRLNKMSKEEITEFCYRLLNQALIIRLDVNSAKDAHKLFETINNRGLRLSSTDILKNFILGNAAKYSEESLETARHMWSRLLLALDGMSIDNFFRAYLVSKLNRRVTRSFVIPYFKAYFSGLVEEAQSDISLQSNYDDRSADEELDDGEELVENATEVRSHVSKVSDKVQFIAFLQDLIRFSEYYSKIVNAKTEDEDVNIRLRGLHLIGGATAVPFLATMYAKGISMRDLAALLDMVNALLFRRFTCKERTNTNENLFATICDFSVEDAVDQFRKVAIRHYPADDEFARYFVSFVYTGSSLSRARYCLERIECALRGNTEEVVIAGSDKVHIEHIIPLKIKTQKAKSEFGDWVSYLGPDAEALHGDYVHRIGNLTLFSGSMNIAASNNPYGDKMDFYKRSDLALTKELVHRYPEWSFEAVDERSKNFAGMAVKLWRID